MKKRLISLLLCLAMVLTLTVPAYAASDEATEAAQKLYELGLFNGTGKDSSGNPIFSLDLVPSRNQAVAMLVRLLGKAEEAENGQWTTPFTDVADWVKPYIGYAYANGLTNGTTATTYSGGRNTTALQYLTFILRALGYQSGVDFEYSKACEFADSIGLTNGQYTAQTANFKRSDVAKISYDALYVFKKGSTKTLGETLAAEGVISLSKYIEVSPAPMAIMSGAKYYSRYPAVLSFENVCPGTKFWFDSEVNYTHLGMAYKYEYYYKMRNLAEAESYAQKYSDFLVNNGYALISVGDNPVSEDRDITYKLTSSDGQYSIMIASSGFSGYTVLVSITPPASLGTNPGTATTPTTPATPSDPATPGTSSGSGITMYSRYKDVPDYGSVTNDSLLLDKGSAKVYFSTKLASYISALEANGYHKASSYTEKYDNSQLLSQTGSISIYENAAGREVHVLEVKDTKVKASIAFVSIDTEIKKPLIAEATSTVVAEQNPYEDASCPYKDDENNYKYGNTDTIYGSPIYVRKAKVSSVSDLQNFLKAKYENIYSPMEDFDVDIQIWDNSNSSSGLVFNIHVDFSYVSPDFDVISPYNFANKYGYTESQKEETRDMIKDMLYEISQDAADCFPDAEISGSIYVSGYHYPHIKVDYFSDQTLTWNRSGDDFRWVPSLDTFSLYN